MAYLRKGRNFHPDRYDKIKTIKAVRAATAVGLKEAKDAVEDAVERGLVIKMEVNRNLSPVHLSDAITGIEENGLVLTHKSQKIDMVLESLKQSAILSAKEDEYELSQLIMNVLVEYEQIEDRREVERMKRVEEEAIRKFKAKERQDKEEQFEHNQRKRWKQQEHEGF